jgi:basic membrane lipoprotein Med (substrate-binding protein (PBP1-ABC) superfamily)
VPQFEAIAGGSWKPEWYWKSDVVGLAPFSPKVPADVKTLIDEYQTKVASGEVKIFDLPDDQLWTYGSQ